MSLSYNSTIVIIDGVRGWYEVLTITQYRQKRGRVCLDEE